MNRHLVIFDVDGTLTQTACMDSQAYITAFKEYLHLSEINSNWHEYRYSTDSGFAIELFEKHFQRKPREEEIQAIKLKFVSLLNRQIDDDPNCCQPLPGALTLFQKIAILKNWDIAIATGCWSESATIKLKSANIKHVDIPMACADDHFERAEIIQVAHERAKISYLQSQYDNIIYVGDRLWDYKASQQLGVKFIGIGAEFLQEKYHHIPKFNDYLTDGFFDYLKHLSMTKN